MSRPPVRDEEALLRAHERRIKLLERRLAASGYLPPHDPRYAGTTAERDAFFGVPATDGERVALANRKVTWFNTDLGWEEGYYATTGLPGLTALGLSAGAASQWLPTGTGPMCVLQPTAGIGTTGGSYVSGWNGITYRRGGAAWFSVTATGIVLNKPGRYGLNGWTIQQSGSGIAVFALRLLNAAGTVTLAAREHGGEPLQGSPVLIPANYEMESLTTEVAQLLLFTVSGSLAVHQTGAAAGVRGQLSATYLGPPLVSN